MDTPVRFGFHCVKRADGRCPIARTPSEPSPSHSATQRRYAASGSHLASWPARGGPRPPGAAAGRSPHLPPLPQLRSRGGQTYGGHTYRPLRASSSPPTGRPQAAIRPCQGSSRPDLASSRTPARRRRQALPGPATPPPYPRCPQVYPQPSPGERQLASVIQTDSQPGAGSHQVHTRVAPIYRTTSQAVPRLSTLHPHPSTLLPTSGHNRGQRGT